MTRLRKRLLVAAAFALLVHSTSYLYLRSTHRIVHHVGWEFDPVGAGVEKAPALHSLRFANYGWIGIGYSGYSFPPSFQYYPMDSIVWYVFSPSAELERMMWTVFKPTVFVADSAFDGRKDTETVSQSR